MGTVLVVDDEASVRYALRELCASLGHEVLTASSAEEALEALDRVDLVLSDYSMPGVDGLELLRRVRARDVGLPVVLVTARGSERLAVAAMKAGAHDYVCKPFDNDELAAVIARGLEARALRDEARRAEAERSLGRAMLAHAPVMRRLLDAVARLADRDVPVLVRGETGVGKELVAELLHAQGGRAKGPLVRFNCAAIPPELAEAELFGHAKGAFTGAAGAREGLVQRARGGTLVLDEVGELPLAVQAKLLRAVQHGEAQPVGAGRVERVDVRWVACTHRDLRAESRAGRFREDLYFRLAVVELRVPPLRERPEDVAPLCAAFVRMYARRFRIAEPRLSPALVDALERRPWPGNVRELENTIARMVALHTGPSLELEALHEGEADAPIERENLAEMSDETSPGLRAQVAEFERALVERTLAACNGNKSEAARRLRIARGTLLEKLERRRDDERE